MLTSCDLSKLKFEERSRAKYVHFHTCEHFRQKEELKMHVSINLQS